MLALLPPSSRVTFFTCSAQPAMIRLPTSVEPVKQTLLDQLVGDEPLADHRALAGQDGQDVLGQSGLERQLADPDRGERGELGRLEHHGVAGGQRGREAPAGDRHREVPRHDHADDAQRLVERDVGAAGDRDLPAEQPLGRPGVVVQAVADVAGLPPGVAPGVAGVADLELGQLVDVRVDDRGEPAQQRCPLARRDRAPGLERLVRGGDRGVGAGQVGQGYVDHGLLRGRVDDGEGVAHKSLESSPELPVGDRRAVRRQLDVGHVGVVVDDLVAERRARQLGRGEPLAGGGQGRRHVLGVGVVGVADQLGLQGQLVLDPVQPAGQHRGEGEVGVGVGARHPVLHPRARAVPDQSDRSRCGCPCPTRSRSARTSRPRTACRS